MVDLCRDRLLDGETWQERGSPKVFACVCPNSDCFVGEKNVYSTSTSEQSMGLFISIFLRDVHLSTQTVFFSPFTSFDPSCQGSIIVISVTGLFWRYNKSLFEFRYLWTNRKGFVASRQVGDYFGLVVLGLANRTHSYSRTWLAKRRPSHVLILY